ncbi:MAG: hypothetical protein GY865_16190 [candidate division Zixibacteria bacterium]|nr:hypothetical protein [candidate division Zixibacteria bacterium]
MSFKSLPQFIFIIVLGGLLILGCEEQSTSPVIEGEPDDNGFEAMSELNEIGLEVMKIPFDLSDTVMAMGGSSSPLFKAHKVNAEVLEYRSLEYAYSNFWHVFSFSAKLVITEDGQTDSLLISGIDSLRYKNAETIVQYPDELLTDEMDIRQHVDINVYNGDGGVLQIKDHASINVTTESFTGEVITLDGAVHDSVAIVSQDSGVQLMDCDIDLTSTQTYNDLVLDETQDCPGSGSIGMSAAFSIDCQGDEGSLSLESAWIATYSFSNGTVSVDIYSNGQHWQSTSICGGV